jgi:hypothetical protein
MTPSPVRREIESAPKDGTRMLVWCVHYNHKFAPHMRPYHREQAIRWLGTLRRWHQVEEAFATVARDLES